MSILQDHGGDCVKFAGDALLVMWEVKGSTGEELLDAYGGRQNTLQTELKPIHARGRLDSTIKNESDRMGIIEDITKRMSKSLTEAVGRAAAVALSLGRSRRLGRSFGGGSVWVTS